jgi:two-component system, chemotaxis family, sensor kinase CheA
MDDEEVIREFLIESSENLARLDNEIVDLERRPKDADLLASIFRTVHTIKGTCGFLGFTTLEAITHEGETILSQVRAGERNVSSALISLVLEVMDVTRTILAEIERTGSEGSDQYTDLVARLKRMAGSTQESEPPATAPVAAAVTPIEAPPVVPAAAPPPPPADKSPAPNKKESDGDSEHHVLAADSAIRVDVGLLDKLMNLVGELVLARNQILQYNTQNEDAALNATSQRLNLITTELQEGVMKTRMQPIGVVWSKLPRVVRDIAHSLGKNIRLEMDGANTELDKTIIEAIKDPLTHLVRNSCDHGVERPEIRARSGKPPQGRILLRAYHEGGQVNIEITDDGGGIDVARIRQKALEKGILRAEQADRISERETLGLIFHPGFSTAETVTNVSGRGVGMDVVKSNIEKIGGLVDVTSRIGEGTTVRLKIPLTLAIIPGLVVTSGDERFVIPQVSLLELIRLEGESGRKQIEHVHGTRVYRRRGSLLPIAYLDEVLKLDVPDESEIINIVVLQAEDRQFGLVVDGINDTQEIVVKPLGKQLKGLATYAGATIMGDGKVALILDVVGIGQRSGVLTATAEQARAEAAQKGQNADAVQRLLLFRAGSFERLAVPLSLVARLEEFQQSVIERASGRRVVQYRDHILPLVSLAGLLDPGGADSAIEQNPIQAIVFKDGDRSIGIVVDQIVDIVEESISVRQRGSRGVLLGSAVVGNRVVDFLDLHAVLESAGEHWFAGHGKAASAPARILLADPSPFSRGLLRSGLEMAGYEVIEAASAPEVLRALEHNHADILLASLDLPPTGAYKLLETVRRQSGQRSLPAIALLDAGGGRGANPEFDFEDYQQKFDWEGMVRSIGNLAARTAADALQETR